MLFHFLYLCAWFIFFGTCQVPDEAVARCTACGADFGAFVRRVGFLLLPPVWLFCAS